MTFRRLNPCSRAKFENFDSLNGGPLSDSISSGITCLLNTRVKSGMTLSAEVVVTNSTTGYRAYWSQNTRAISLIGNGPAKSTRPFFQGPLGISIIRRGSLALHTTVAWQLKDFPTRLSTIASIPENHT